LGAHAFSHADATAGTKLNGATGTDGKAHTSKYSDVSANSGVLAKRRGRGAAISKAVREFSGVDKSGRIAKSATR
jgi:hypothetical protein